MLHKCGVMVKGCVTAQKRNWDSNSIGLANENPFLDTQSYLANFDYGDQTEMTGNMIAKSSYLQCDPDNNQYALLEEIVDHRCFPAAVKLSDQKIVRADGKTYLKCTTVGWQH